MNDFKRYLLLLGTAAALLLFGSNAVATSALYEEGMEAVDGYRYSLAMMRFKEAAEHGDRDAQRNLGLMLMYGEKLYGADVVRDRQLARRWLRAAAEQGCEVSSFVLKMMDGRSD